MNSVELPDTLVSLFKVIEGKCKKVMHGFTLKKTLDVGKRFVIIGKDNYIATSPVQTIISCNLEKDRISFKTKNSKYLIKAME